MFRRLLSHFTTRTRPSDDEIARELRDHLDLDAEVLTKSGKAAPSGALFEARRRFGNVSSVGEEVHDVWHSAWLEQLAQDIRHGTRALARSPAYSVAIVTTLAIGIGAAAAMYSLSNAIHTPFPRLPQDKLLWITFSNASCTPDCTELSPPGLIALGSRAPAMTAIGVAGWNPALRSAGGSELVRGYQVSPNTFEVIGAPFALGHGFPARAAAQEWVSVTVLSYNFWHDRLAASRGVLDSVITLDGKAYTVTGVLDKDVIFPQAADVYAPLVLTAAAASQYGARYLQVFARRAPGATLATARAQARAIGAQLAREAPRSDSGWVMAARPIADYHTDDLAILIRISGIAALLVFVAACMSAANLALSRIAARRHELGLRMALGVRRWRLARHLLTEALLLSLVAGAIGAALAQWGAHAIRDAIPPNFAVFVPGWVRIGVTPRTLVFAFGAAVAAMFAFALLPVLRATRVDLAAVLSDGGRASTGGTQSTRMRATLIVLEVSIALVLLTAATLFTRSVRNMIAGDAGVRLEHALVMPVTIPQLMGDSAATDFYRRLDENLRMEPGVRAAGMASTTPLSNNFWGTKFAIPGRAPEPGGRTLSAIDQHVTPGYAAAAGVRTVSGRMIDAHDVAGAEHAIVVNRMMADAMWPRGNAIGETVIIDSTTWTVVGVSANVYHGGLDEPMRYTVYRSLYQAPQHYGALAVWTAGDPDGMRDSIRRVVARTDASVAVGEMMTMQAMQARHVSAFSMMAGMLAVLALVTMTIATVGLYGLIAYGVAQRTREIGVRIALGARPRDIVAQISGSAVRLTAIGVVVGVVGAAAFARLLTAMLYGVSASDPRTYVAVSGALVVVALTAAVIPSWRAARVDPTVALRD
jgi:putative ABC transport system permease protein